MPVKWQRRLKVPSVWRVKSFSSAGWLLHSNLAVPKSLVCPRKPMSITIARTAKPEEFRCLFLSSKICFILIKSQWWIVIKFATNQDILIKQWSILTTIFVVTQDHVLTDNHGPAGQEDARALMQVSLRQDENDYIDHNPLLVTVTFTKFFFCFFGCH